MNLKEAFRFQKHLDELKHACCDFLYCKENNICVTKIHNRAKVNPEALDFEEEIKPEFKYTTNSVIKFMKYLIKEKELLSNQITRAKSSVNFDIDAAIEANKYRQAFSISLRRMLSMPLTKRVESGKDYKFNAEGNQMPYCYDIEVISTEMYDRENAKAIMREMTQTADRVSAEIDSVIINTKVDYVAPFDVNDSFDDVLEKFMSNNEDKI